MNKLFLTLLALALATDAMGQLRPNMPNPPLIPNLPPIPSIPPLRPQPPIRPVQPIPPSVDYPTVPTGRTAQAIIRTELRHGQTIGIRRVLNDLLQGDFVKSIQGYAQARQRGAYLEVIMDNAVITRIDLTNGLGLFQVEIRRVNGVDYNRLMLRSIGNTYVDSIQANIGDDNQYPDDPNLPPLPPGPDYPTQPDQPTQPIYPPSNGSLSGYCDDIDHSQFSAAKNFAYSGSGLDLSSDQSVEWAIQFNQTHACGTIQEYMSRFSILKNFAYSGSGLDMSSRDAVNYALSKVETTTVDQAQRMQSTLTAIKNFAYSGSGLDLSSGEAANIGRQWIDRGYCEDENRIAEIAERYRAEYNFAYSGSGLNYDSARAKQYALSRIRQMSVCGDLLK